MSVESVSEVRVYRASSMREALRLVREELGPGALILRAETLRSKRWFGKAKIDGVEVHAQASERRESEEQGGPRILRFPGLRSQAPATQTVERSSKPVPAKASSETVFRQVQVASPSPAPSPGAKVSASKTAAEKTPPAEREARKLLRGALLRAGFPSDAIERELDQLFAAAGPHERTDAATLLPLLARRFAQTLRVERGALPMPGSSLSIALVGATGVGKTTTAAKLAARYSLDNGLSVGFVGVDTYRMGAVDQLQEYAKLLEVPLCIATSPTEMRRAMQQLADCDVVLVDTAGRSPLDARSVSELAGILDAGEIDHVWIAASATTHAGAFANSIERLSPLAPTGLVLTKLDEQEACGHLWPTLSTIELPTFYVAEGQRVPEDLAPADAKRLARALIGVPASSERKARETNENERTESKLKRAA